MERSGVERPEVFMTKDCIDELQIEANEQKVALVLIIEDNPAQQRLFWLIKDAVGMIPCVVGNSAEALEAVSHARFNLIMLNLHIPHVEALECARKIRLLEAERGTKTPIIAVTANAMPGDRERCLDAGMDDYLAKPFPLVLLKEKIIQWAA